MHRLKDNAKTACVHVQKKREQNYLTVQYVRVSAGEVCVSEPTYLVTRHFCGNKQCSIVSSGHSLLWNMEFKTLFERRRPVLFFKVYPRVGNGGWTVQAEQRQAAEDTWRKKSHL